MEEEPQDPLQGQEVPEFQDIFMQQEDEILHMEEAPWEEPQNPLQEQEVPEIQHQFQLEGEIQQIWVAPQQEPQDPSDGDVDGGDDGDNNNDWDDENNVASVETHSQVEHLRGQISVGTDFRLIQLRPQDPHLASEILQIDHQVPETSRQVSNPVISLERLQAALQSQRLGREISQMEQDTQDTELERQVPQMGRQALAMGHRGIQSRRQSWRRNRQTHSLESMQQSPEYEAPELVPRRSSLPTSNEFYPIDPPSHSHEGPPIVRPLPFRNFRVDVMENTLSQSVGSELHILQHQHRDHVLHTLEDEVPQSEGQDLSSIDTDEQSSSMITPSDMEHQIATPEQNSPLSDEVVPQMEDLALSPNHDLSPS